MTIVSRSFPLEDIHVRSGGDGRTVEAYAAVFNTDTEVMDQHGHYLERINRAAFNRTVAHRGTNFGVFYNHGKTIHGTPSERASMPLGSPVEAPRADARGLITVTRYNKTQQADEVLEAIRNGDIRGQSFSGRFVRSDKEAPRGIGFRAGRDGSLTKVERLEIAMIEYGPTPLPVYDVPMVVGVRSLALQIADLTEAERADLARMIGQSTPLDPAQAAEDPDEAPATAPAGAPGAEDPQQRSGRLTPAQRARVGAILRGL